MEIFKKLVLLFLLSPLFSLSQNDDINFYKHIEPRIYIGVSQWLGGSNNRFDIKNPAYEFGITYSFSLPNNFVLYPYIGYNSITINNGIYYQALEKFETIIAGTSIYYKLNRWNFGVSIYGKDILDVLVGSEHNTHWENANSFEYWSTYYLGGLTVLYSFSHFNLIAEARFNLFGMHYTIIPYTGTIHINEYMIGIGYHL
jgi:hypothetical protein